MTRLKRISNFWKEKNYHTSKKQEEKRPNIKVTAKQL
jgi:hypothetical protein